MVQILLQVLAVGVDNIFILVDSFQRSEWEANCKDPENLPSHFGQVIGEVVPSMFTSTAAQVNYSKACKL